MQDSPYLPIRWHRFDSRRGQNFNYCIETGCVSFVCVLPVLYLALVLKFY